jgi:Flp pilus assembly protein CpaB
VSRRGRAIAFGAAALVAAVTAAAIANGYGDSVARGYGELRPVVVATEALAAGKQIDAAAEGALEVRRVPIRFVPDGALRNPAEATGLVPAAAVPGGAYLLAAQLRPPRSPSSGPAIGAGRRPVQIAVSGADALAVAGTDPVGSRVDVVVTTEPDGPGAGHTYVAAAAVPLLALGPGPEGDTGATANATLGLTRPQALRLIAAESFARQVTVMPRS